MRTETEGCRRLETTGDAGGIGTVGGWGLCFLRASSVTSMPSWLLMVTLDVERPPGTKSRAFVLRRGALAVEGVGGGDDMEGGG